MKTIAERLKWAREKKGLSQPQLAALAGVSPGTIGNVESGQRKRPRELLAIAAALGVTPQWLEDGTGPVEVGGASDESGVELEPAGRPRAVRRIPVVGTAKLGDDGYFERVEGDGWITGYTDDQEAFALRVKGDSMHPAIRHGHFVVVAPNSACTPGEYVVIERTDGRKMVKELIFERSDEIVIESVNGNHRRTIEKSEVEKMCPVVAVVPPSRWRPD